MSGKLSYWIARHHNPLTFSLFIVSTFFLVRWSDLPVLSMPWGIEKIFIKSYSVGDVSIAIVTGYFSGYIIYLLTTQLPYIFRSYPVQKQAVCELTSIYYRIIMMMLLMYKNACDANMWSNVISNKKKDIDCFDDTYYTVMKSFDVNSSADTMLLHKDGTSLSWLERIQVELEALYAHLDKIFLSKHFYLKEEIMNVIINMQRINIMQMFTGNYTTISPMLQGKDGYYYYEYVPLSMINPDTLQPYYLFQGDNIEQLKSDILSIADLYRVLVKHNNNLKKSYALSKLSNAHTGHLRTLIDSKLFSIIRRRILDGITLKELTETYGRYVVLNFMDSVRARVDYSKEPPTPSVDSLFDRVNDLTFKEVKDILEQTLSN